jgi:hypothetical protein
MEYRGIEYTVVQGIGRQVWKWSVSFEADVSVKGQAAIKSEAVAEAERAIDRALAPKKLRLVPQAADHGGPILFARLGVMRGDEPPP